MMKRLRTIYFLLGLSAMVMFFALTYSTANAQEENIEYAYDNGNITVRFNAKVDSIKLEQMLQTINCSIAIADSLKDLSAYKVSESGWELSLFSKDIIEFRKKLDHLKSDGKNEHILLDDQVSINNQTYNLDVTYGLNQFKNKPSIVEVEENLFTFYLDGYANSKQVYLSGTFNNWSTLGLPMRLNGNRWEISIKLKKGKHLYKFISDGKWLLDPANALKENDYQGHTNSVFFNYNYTFTLFGYNKAQKVFLAGSFNDWKPKQLKMIRENGRWTLNMYLQEGFHTYKFIVDGQWILDPENPKQTENGMGNMNSVISFGKPFTFKLSAFREATKVNLTGDFNRWNESELVMSRDVYGDWIFPIALKPGNYNYKYIVDGRWELDPRNPHTIGSGDYKNSVISVNANHAFTLEGFEDASTVILTGTFNNWSEDGYTMKKENGIWRMSIFLPQGKTRYKFIVDGKWIIDPKNPLYENNDVGTEDSIIWMK